MLARITISELTTAVIDQKKTNVFPAENIVTVVSSISVPRSRAMKNRHVKEKPCYSLFRGRSPSGTNGSIAVQGLLHKEVAPTSSF